MKSNVHALKEKEQIMKELFRDVNSKQCVLELYIISQFKDNKISQVSNESDEFLKKMNKELLREYNNGNILFFRKYNYEKIFNPSDSGFVLELFGLREQRRRTDSCTGDNDEY